MARPLTDLERKRLELKWTGVSSEHTSASSGKMRFVVSLEVVQGQERWYWQVEFGETTHSHHEYLSMAGAQLAAERWYQSFVEEDAERAFTMGGSGAE